MLVIACLEKLRHVMGLDPYNVEWAEVKNPVSDNPIDLVSYTSRSLLTSSPSPMSPRVRERSPRNMTSGKTWQLSGLFMSACRMLEECITVWKGKQDF